MLALHKPPSRRWFALFGVVVFVASALAYLYGRVSCAAEQRLQHSVNSETLSEVNNAKTLLLQIRHLQDKLDQKTRAEAAAAAHTATQAADLAATSALLKDLQVLKDQLTTRRVGHDTHTHPPAASSVTILSGDATIVSAKPIPHESHVHGDQPHHHSEAGHTHENGQIPKSLDPKNKAHDHLADRVNETPALAPADTPHDPQFAKKDPKKQCAIWAKQFHVQPGISWGHLSPELMTEWTLFDCDHHIGGMKPKPRATPTPTKWAVKSVLLPGETHEVIAICVAVSTRGIKRLTLEGLALFHGLLPSFARTAAIGFEYRIYVAYDVGDVWFDNRHNRDTATLWFAERVALPLASIKGINATLFWHSFENARKKPGPAFNSVTRAAYKDGAHWLYRINDDSVLDTPWAIELTSKLKEFGPPFGAVGPWCTFGNTAILTHDMTHRTHMQIFGGVDSDSDNSDGDVIGYYPPKLEDWWMDDWVTRVYGRQRTRRMREVVVTHNGEHGTRYSVDHSHGGLVDGLLRKGREKIVAFLKRKNYDPEIITSFGADTSEFTVIAG